MSSMLMNPKAKKVYPTWYQQLQGVAKGLEGEPGHQGGTLEGLQDMLQTKDQERQHQNKNKNTI